MYLPVAFGFSKRKMCAVATSSICTMDIQLGNSRRMSSPAQIENMRQICIFSICLLRFSENCVHQSGHVHEAQQTDIII